MLTIINVNANSHSYELVLSVLKPAESMNISLIMDAFVTKAMLKSMEFVDHVHQAHCLILPKLHVSVSMLNNTLFSLRTVV